MSEPTLREALPTRRDLAETLCYLARHEHQEPSCPTQRQEADRIVRALSARYMVRDKRAALAPADAHDDLAVLAAEVAGDWSGDEAVRRIDTAEGRVYVLGPFPALARADDGLSEAWAEAEAALPGGWYLDRLVRDWDHSVGYEWRVAANRGDGSLARGFGPTPAAALRALAARLAAEEKP